MFAISDRKTILINDNPSHGNDTFIVSFQINVVPIVVRFSTVLLKILLVPVRSSAAQIQI